MANKIRFEKLESYNLTEKQKRLIPLAVANLTSPKPKTKGQLLLEAGYSKTSATIPTKIFDSPKVQKALTDFTKNLQLKRDLALQAITAKKLQSAKPKDLATIVDLLNKNVRLETGESTDNMQFSLKDLYNKSIAE